jgi:hypothetical protein
VVEADNHRQGLVDVLLYSVTLVDRIFLSRLLGGAKDVFQRWSGRSSEKEAVRERG